MTEVWKDIKNYEGLYEVSNLGRVRSCKSGHILNPYESSDSYNGRGVYSRYGLTKDNVQKKKSGHLLVISAFFGDVPAGFVVDHIDGNKFNNALDNLQIIPKHLNMLKGLYLDSNEFESSSKYLGVKYNGYTVQINDSLGKVYLGTFEDELEAAVYAAAAYYECNINKTILSDLPINERLEIVETTIEDLGITKENIKTAKEYLVDAINQLKINKV